VFQILPEVTPEIVPGTEENKTVYRARIPSAGSFHCSETGLGFEVSTAVTVEYEYGSWAESLSPSARQEWMVAGPLFHIRAKPNTVRAVHLPHFLCLADGGDLSSCKIAHFEAGHMTLETPARIHVFRVVLENPSFSQLGVLWRKIRSTITFIPIHSLVLIYRALRAADITLHLYLIPNDHSLRKAIEEEETKWESKHIPKPPQTNALYFGSQYEVSGTSELKITPDQLELCYRSPADQQSYIELYMTDMEKEIKLHMKDRKDGKLVWKTFVRPARGVSFVKQHREELRNRMGAIYPILARLRDIEAMNSDEEEEVLSMRNRRKSVLWKKIRSAIKCIPIHSHVLIYRTLSAADVTLHLYLIPNDHSLRKQLHFCYWSPVEQQSYIEIYTRVMEKEIRLHVNGQDDGSLVWEALVRPGDVSLSALSSQTLTGAAFVGKHRRQLRVQMGQIQPVLVHLRVAQLLSSEEEEEVRSEQTSQMMNDALLQLVERKGARAQEELYQTLRETDPYLVQDLEQSS
ncbi:NACHT, LRR and PYD domains-containing protein 1, partial [Chelonia mydas]